MFETNLSSRTLKYLREIFDAVPENGGKIEKAIINKHIKLYLIFGTQRRVITVSASASDRRAIMNVKSDIRRTAKECQQITH